MANGIYTAAKEQLIRGNVDWVNDEIMAVLVSADYTVDLSAHATLEDVPEAARVAMGALSGKEADGASALADALTLTAVTGDEVVGILLVQYGISDAESNLLVWIDTDDELPFTPDGSDVTLSWASDTVFTL
ncbi:hypothetical protein KQI63_15830 [bacterium]|nr:hypothetical protein [bacterium]